jgi:GNAT superfamily N-acetyltransferase
VGDIDVRRVDVADESQLREWWTSGHAAMSTRPVDLWPDWEISRLALPQADPDNRVVLLGSYSDDAIVGSSLVFLPLLDNTHLGAVEVYVPPEHRRRGVGTALLDRSEELITGEGRTTLLGDVRVPLDEDNDDRRWAEARGYSIANVDGVKVADLAATADRLPTLEARAAERLGDYRLAWWTDPAPEEHLASLAAAMSRFVEEIPLGDLDFRPEAWTPERLRGREASRAAQHRDQLTVVALAPSGEVAGFTDLTLAPHAPRLVDIGETLVLPDHRGHRLGLAVKVLLHQQVRALHPGAELIATGNATTNRWMNDVNEQLGYRPVDRNLELQKVLGEDEARKAR